MKPKKRLESMNSWKEIFQIPTVLYFPGLMISIAIAALSFLVEPFSIGYLAGGVIAIALFGILIVFSIILPAARASALKQDGIQTQALVIKKEKRSRFAGTLDPGNRIQTSFTVVAFEFTPQGANSPLQIEAEVAKVTASMQEGKMMKITYAKSNPRIIRLPGE